VDRSRFLDEVEGKMERGLELKVERVEFEGVGRCEGRCGRRGMEGIGSKVREKGNF
jgi:hypothetical protein